MIESLTIYSENKDIFKIPTFTVCWILKKFLKELWEGGQLDVTLK